MHRSQSTQCKCAMHQVAKNAVSVLHQQHIFTSCGLEPANTGQRGQFEPAMVADLHQEGPATMRLIKTSIVCFWADSILPHDSNVHFWHLFCKKLLPALGSLGAVLVFRISLKKRRLRRPGLTAYSNRWFLTRKNLK